VPRANLPESVSEGASKLYTGGGNTGQMALGAASHARAIVFPVTASAKTSANAKRAAAALALAVAGFLFARASSGDEAEAGGYIAPDRPRPPTVASERRVCSWREPICVHGDASAATLLALLESAERAWEIETGALELPAPDPDLVTGAYDLYVRRGVPEGTASFPSARDPRSRIDRASAYTLFDTALAIGDACERDAAVAASVARASLYRAAPATDEGSARAQAAYVARLAVPCAMGMLDGVDTFQSRPERSFADPAVGDADSRRSAEFARGASLFYWWLDASYSMAPGGIVRAIWALKPTMTPPGADRWKDEPDGVDVLRETFKDALMSGSRLEDLLAEFGTTRALLGPRDNGTELAEARPLGDALVPRVDWTVDWPAHPRRLASPVGIAPAGSTYVLIHRAGAPPGSRLRLEATWERHADIRWTALKLDAAGRELGRIPIGAAPRVTEAQGTVTGLDLASDVLVVGTNVGDPFVPFDPDDERFEPHGWLLTLDAE
jgi:hypothetical protein